MAYFRGIFSLLIGSIIFLFTATSCLANEGVQGRINLRVALFPYIPDAASDKYLSLRQVIETSFEKEHPNIDLSIRPLSQNDDFYDLEQLEKWLTSDESENSYDVVEVDTVLLGDLVAKGLISPWESPPDKTDWQPVGTRAVTINEAIYGIPHLLCGHFLITRSQEIASADSFSELEQVFKAQGNQIRDLAGNFLGSWNLPALYLDAWKDSYPSRNVAFGLTEQLEPRIISGFKKLTSHCLQNGQNPCLDGTYDDWKKPTLAADEFSAGKADALFGYSERLHYVLKAADDDESILIAPAPLGEGNFPVLFVDAFVVRAESSPSVVMAAAKFSRFMNSAKMQEVLLMSLDAPAGSVPRYLIPATKSAFDAPKVSVDRFYITIERALESSDPYPNTGFLNIRTKMRDKIRQQIQATE